MNWMASKAGPEDRLPPPPHTDPPFHTDLVSLTGAWCSRTRAVEKAHFRRCVRFRTQHVVLGCVTIACSTLLGVLVNTDPNSSLHFIVEDIKPILTVVVPVLTALVSFLRFDERSAMHHVSAAKFASLKRKLQLEYTQCISRPGNCDPDICKTLVEVCRVWDELTNQSPALYKTDWAEIALYDDEIRSARFGSAKPSGSGG